jgi:DNA-binding transcriptional LysR family regulator
MKQYLRWPHLSIDFGQRGVDQILEARDSPRRIAVAMPYHVLGTSILPGTELLLTVPARLAAEFADPRRTRVLAAPRELGDLHFYSVWHPRADQDPSHTWLREIVRTVAAATPPRRRRASKTIAGA